MDGRAYPTSEELSMTDAGDLFSLADKTAVVTGTSAGIGARLARTLVLAGARVAAIARRPTVLDDAAMATDRLLSLSADLSDHEQTMSVADECLALFDGRVDILVNNAGFIAAGVKAQDESYDDIRRTLSINLEAPILLAQKFFLGMKAAGSGSIINISSMSASGGNGFFPQAVYASSKGGIEALTREWATQWGRYGIRVNNLAPGFIETEITQNVINHPKVQDWILRNTLLPRHGQPDDFDGALLLLASEAGRYITGQTITVDGGWTAH
jgi:NAD(P)-dependent dehydrogenase (short-subunit alcohol dehydrogenase family)